MANINLEQLQNQEPIVFQINKIIQDEYEKLKAISKNYDDTTELKRLEMCVKVKETEIENQMKSLRLCSVDSIRDMIFSDLEILSKELENLIDIARIKYISKKLDIEKIASRKDAVVFTFKASGSEDKFKIDIAQLVKKYGTKIKFSAGIKPMITLDIGTSSERKILKDTTEFVKYLLG